MDGKFSGVQFEPQDRFEDCRSRKRSAVIALSLEVQSLKHL
jgi:hypothetical protein